MQHIEKTLRLFSDEVLHETAELKVTRNSSGLIHVEITDSKGMVHYYNGEKLNHFGSDIVGALTNLDNMIEKLEKGEYKNIMQEIYDGVKNS